MGTPKGMNLSKLLDEYAEESKSREYLEALRWPDGIACPRCAGKIISTIGTNGIYECVPCHYQFTVRVGTVLQDSKLPIRKWFVAVFLITESKKGISANQLRRMVGSTYKTAWYLSHRIREAMYEATGHAPLTGTVEVDETFVGGKPRQRRRRKGGSPLGSKTMVLGAVARGGGVRLRVSRAYRSSGVLHDFIDDAVRDDTSAIFTDAAPAYGDMNDRDTRHESVNHTANEWVRGDVHTNNIESVWSLFKRSLIGSYHHMSVKHMQSYLEEIEWRFNNRHNDHLFRDTLRALVKSEVLTYRRLIQRPA